MSATRPDFDDHERRRWAGRAAAYERSFAPLCAYPADTLLDAARVEAGRRVLDAGTGTGTLAARAHARGAHVVAVDAEPGMLDRTRHHVPAVCAAALPDLPFAGGQFDAAVANFVINHVGDPTAALTELRRVVRPGGRVAATIWPAPAPTTMQLWGRILDAAGAEPPATMPRLDRDKDFPRTVPGFGDLLRGAGLTQVHCVAVSWTHHADLEDWWSGPANGIATPGFVMQHQSPATITRIRARYDELTAAYRGQDGRLALPAHALLAYGIVG